MVYSRKRFPSCRLRSPLKPDALLWRLEGCEGGGHLGVGLFLVPLGFIANPALLQLAATPELALAALTKIGLGLLFVSFAIVGGHRSTLLEVLRVPALGLGLGTIFLMGV